MQKLAEAGEITLNGFFSKKYSHTYFSRKFLGLDSYPNVTHRTISSLLSRLKDQGLVERRGKSGTSVWFLTTKGTTRLKKEMVKIPPVIPATDGITRLVIFDIPERDRKKRHRIRTELLSHNFRALQRSVWIGENPLSEDFIELLDLLKLGNYVHIFTINKIGTLYQKE